MSSSNRGSCYQEVDTSSYVKLEDTAASSLVSHAAWHTPPEVWVRARKNFITFDTNFGRYLPRGTIIDRSRKFRMGAFCTIEKNSGEKPKKDLKTGQNGVKFFFSPHTCWIITFVAIFYFHYFSFWYLEDPVFWTNFHKIVKKRGSVKHQNEKYWK